MTEDIKSKFEELFQKGPLPYQSLDSNGNILLANDSWLETLGYKREEVIGKWFGDFLGPEDREKFQKNFPIFKERGIISGIEFKLLHKDGRFVPVTYEGRVLKDENGNFQQTHCVFIDLTKYKKDHTDMQSKIDELEGINKIMVTREYKIGELEKKIKDLGDQ